MIKPGKYIYYFFCPISSNTRTLSDPTARLSADEQFATAEDGTSTSVSLKKQDSLDTSTASAATPNASTAGGPRKSYDSKSLPIRNDGSLDYDALYEDESDNDLSMESHGSVVTHLLSQVKIGMDLTKVVLPTFILERRSLLEMYADYFAHPDLFLRIADLNDPRERMVQVVRWYLSAYHAGRKSSVAKKPYNPILGEIFQCHWDTPDMRKSSLPPRTTIGLICNQIYYGVTRLLEEITNHHRFFLFVFFSR